MLRNTNTRLIALALGLLGTLGIALPAIGGAVATPGQGARALALGGTFIGTADDPSAVFYNPGGLARTEGTAVEVDVSYMDVQVTHRPVGGSHQESDKDIWAPGVFVATDLGSAVLGFGVYSAFARDSRYSGDFATGFPALKGDNLRIDYTPVLAFQLGEKLSIGAGPVYATLDLEETSPGLGGTSINSESDGDGWGGIIGIHYQATDKLDVGLVYRSRVKVDTEGDSTITAPGVGVVGTADFDLDWKYPSQVGLGLGFQASDNLRITADAVWNEWSYWDEVAVDLKGPAPDPPPYIIDGQDSWTIGVGAELDVSDATTFRVGYGYDENGINMDRIQPARPDATGHIVSVGVGHDISESVGVDIAYVKALLDEDESAGSLNGFPGKYEIEAQMVILSLLAHF